MPQQNPYTRFLISPEEVIALSFDVDENTYSV